MHSYLYLGLAVPHPNLLYLARSLSYLALLHPILPHPILLHSIFPYTSLLTLLLVLVLDRQTHVTHNVCHNPTHVNMGQVT